MNSGNDRKPFLECVRGFISAVRLITVLPMPGREADSIASSQPWFPLVGAMLGGLATLTGFAVFSLTAIPEFAALTVVVAGAVLTRCLHLDGLSDWADGFWGGFTPEKRLAIMKDSRIGAFGAVALISVLLAKWIALTRIIAADGWAWIMVAYVVSRAMQVLLACAQPYARAEGGTGHDFVKDADPGRAGAALLAGAVLILLTRIGITDLSIAGGGALVITLVFGAWCRRMVGGVTGDLLGACSELVEVWILLLGGTVAA